MIERKNFYTLVFSLTISMLALLCERVNAGENAWSWICWIIVAILLLMPLLAGLAMKEVRRDALSD